MEADKIYFAIREKILNLEYLPGTELLYSDLIKEYKVSRSPIRDALKKLAEAKLVDILPQRGTSVSKIDLDNIEDERFIRKNLELGTLESFMQNKKAKDIQMFEDIIAEQKKAFATRNNKLFLSLDDQMHKIFFSVSKKETVYNLILNQSGNYHRIRLISYKFDSIAQDVIKQHEQLLQAIKDDNSELLRALNIQHLSKLSKEIQDYILAMPEYFNK